MQEAARIGNVEVVEALLDSGADLNARTKGSGEGASGGSPLWWALQYHPEDHPMVELLKSRGAKIFGPGAAHEEL